MNKACYSNNYFYKNHSNQCVCFNYQFKKRVKTKVTNFLKNEHQESKIKEYLDDLGLKLTKYLVTNRYVHYIIEDKEL